jgi:hypothetical protein
MENDGAANNSRRSPFKTIIQVVWRSGFEGGRVPETTDVGTVLADIAAPSAVTKTSADNAVSVAGTTLVLAASLSYAEAPFHPIRLECSPDGFNTFAVDFMVLVPDPSGVSAPAPTLTALLNFISGPIQFQGVPSPSRMCSVMFPLTFGHFHSRLCLRPG